MDCKGWLSPAVHQGVLEGLTVFDFRVEREESLGDGVVALSFCVRKGQDCIVETWKIDFSFSPDKRA